MQSSRSSNRYRPTRRSALATFAGLGGASLFGCRIPDSHEAPDRQEALRQTVANVMHPTFVELADKTAALVRSTAALDAASLPDVRRLFREARAVWSRSEAFLLGPSDDLAITGGAIDSWPAGGAALDALISGSEVIDAALIGRSAANMRGFPGLEYLLFDAPSNDDAATRLLLEQARRRELVVALAIDLAEKCGAIRDGWNGEHAFGYQLAEAGRAATLFATQKDAIDKIVTAMVALAERVLVAKLAKPLGLDTGGAPRPDLEEAPKSDGSLATIEHNLRGLRAVYDCELDYRNGDSLSRAVAALSSNADRAFHTALDNALAAVAAVGSPMRVALAGDRSKLVALHAAVQVVKRSLTTDVASTLGASIGFGYSDTD